MQMTENPATALRCTVEALRPPGMLRWDRTGRALLVSDAPRRPEYDDFQARLAEIGAVCFEADGLLYIDLPGEAYAALLHAKAPSAVAFSDFETAALLRSILRRPVLGDRSNPDISLLCGALLARAQGSDAVRLFAHVLRAADAEALRVGETASARAAAAVLAMEENSWEDAKGLCPAESHQRD